MPRLEFAFLADAADAEPGRKFYVLGGGIDTIGAVSFPVVHPHIALLLRLLIHPMEADRQHSLEIGLIDNDGHELARIDGNFSANQVEVTGRDAAMNIVLNFANTQFEQPGDYSFEIMIDNQHVKSLPLYVQELPPPG